MGVTIKAIAIKRGDINMEIVVIEQNSIVVQWITMIGLEI